MRAILFAAGWKRSRARGGGEESLKKTHPYICFLPPNLKLSGDPSGPPLGSEALPADCASITKMARVGRLGREGGGGALYQQAQTLFGKVISGSVLNTVCACCRA